MRLFELSVDKREREREREGLALFPAFSKSANGGSELFGESITLLIAGCDTLHQNQMIANEIPDYFTSHVFSQPVQQGKGTIPILTWKFVLRTKKCHIR